MLKGWGKSATKAASEWGDRVRLKGASIKRNLGSKGSYGSLAGDEAAAAAGDGPTPRLPTGVLPGRETSEEEAEQVLASVPPAYYGQPGTAGGFDPLDHELHRLPLDFGPDALEGVAEERTGVLEVVSERLSRHVVANYDRFVAGVAEVAAVEAEVSAAHVTAKTAREQLAVTMRKVSANIAIARDTKRKQRLVALLEVLLKLQQAANLQRALKEAQENGEFAEALWLCAQCTRAMDELGSDLRVAQELTVTVNRLYQETSQRLEGALAAVCGDFRPTSYTKVLEGYLFLGNVASLGAEVKAAFASTIAGSVAKVVHGVLLTRPGMEERASSNASLQDLVRLLPSDLFRTCLARALMVIFDILVSHFHMVRWHEAALEQHAADLDGLRAARATLSSQLGGAGSSQAVAAAGSRSSSRPSSSGGDPTTDGGGERASVTGRAMMQLQRGTPSELEEIEAKASDEQEWGEVLRAVQTGLLAGRQLIWEEAARRIGILLSSPAAFEGEHFLQVMEWTQRALAVGESFSGAECASLRTLLQRQAANFFRAFHHSNLEALNSMLDKEMWRPLPAVLPSLVAAASGVAAARSSSEEGGLPPPSSFTDFETVVSMGNPWRRQQGSPRRKPVPKQQLGFGGAAAGDTAAAAHLEVDEYGVPLSAPATPSSAQQPGSSEEAEPPVAQQSSEAAELFGDYIDEETQQARLADGATAGPASRAGGRSCGPGSPGAGAVTNSSWRMSRWMGNYASLMRTLPAAAPAIFAGLAELYDLYMLHVFIAFGDAGIGELLAAAHAQQHGGAAASALDAAMSPRLRGTLLRVATESIGKYLQLFASAAAASGSSGVDGGGSKVVRALTSGPAASPSSSSSAGAMPGLPGAPGGTSSSTQSGGPAFAQYFGRRAAASPPAGGLAAAGAAMQQPHQPQQYFQQQPQQPHQPPGQAAAAAAAVAAAAAPAGVEISAVSNSGNLYGLLERSVAAESLLAVAERLGAARHELSALLPPGEAHAGLESFYSRTVGAAEDLRDHVLRAGARALLPIRWVPDRVASASYVIAEPPTSHARWVDELEAQLQLFADRLAAAQGLPAATVERLWQHAQAYVAECVLAGVVAVRRCSLEGRAAMAVDLQGLAHALGSRLPRGVGLNLRLVDDYIKAFYIPQSELTLWAARHPQYSPGQVLALASCIAESSGMKKKDKAALLAAVEAQLRGVAL